MEIIFIFNVGRGSEESGACVCVCVRVCLLISLRFCISSAPNILTLQWPHQHPRITREHTMPNLEDEDAQTSQDSYKPWHFRSLLPYSCTLAAVHM